MKKENIEDFAKAIKKMHEAQLAALEDYQLRLLRHTKKLMTVDEWTNLEKISEKDQLEYPNARTAAAIKSSPLYKALE